ncbi:MAG: hypothetical protein EZS28_036826 [Streblomastix strix]|uniref:Uncharacterized protein n=1 Tax=Streblomastix strix TaxID=222440 RepID=A0A5J4UAR3_9EUKA|nr:MAG: hypothetical protein EZS28_036826 [Streblomastix strix]
MIDALSIIVQDAANHKFIITDSFLSKLFDLLRSDSQTKCNISHEARLLLSWVTDNELMKRIETIRDIVINDEEKEDENKNGSKESIKQQIDVQQEQEQNGTTEYQQQTSPHIQSVISQLPEFASIIKKIVSRDDLEGGRLIICEIANWITNEPEILELMLRRENINNDVIQALLQLLDSQPTDTVSIEYVIPIYKITNYCDEEYRSQLVQKGCEFNMLDLVIMCQ